MCTYNIHSNLFWQNFFHRILIPPLHAFGLKGECPSAISDHDSLKIVNICVYHKWRGVRRLFAVLEVKLLDNWYAMMSFIFTLTIFVYLSQFDISKAFVETKYFNIEKALIHTLDFLLQKNLCQFATQDHKFKSWYIFSCLKNIFFFKTALFKLTLQDRKKNQKLCRIVII